MREIKIQNFLFILAIIICLSFPFLSFYKPVMDLNVLYENAAKEINAKGIAYLTRQYFFDQITYAHPPVFILSLSLFYKLFGKNLFSLHLLGWISFFIMIILVYYLTRAIFTEDKNSLTIARIAAFLYASCPFLIQGAVMLEIDNTVLPVAISIFIITFVKIYNKINFPRMIMLSFLFALALWTKITTPLAIILAVSLFYFAKRDFRNALKLPLLISIIGVSLFLCTFFFYCKYIASFSCLKVVPLVFSVAWIKQPLGSIFFKLVTMFKIIIRLSFWISPFFLFLWFIGLTTSLKHIFRERKILPMEFLSIYSCVILLGYLYFGGSHVYPRYHLPMMMAVAIISAAVVSRFFLELNTKEKLIYLFITLLLIVYYIFIVGDVLYLTNFKLKEAVILNTIASAIPELKLHLLLYGFPFFILFLGIKLFKRKYVLIKNFVLTSLILAIAVNISLNVLQAKAKYETLDWYGTEARDEVLTFLRRNMPYDPKIIAPVDINYYLGKRSYPMDPFVELGLKYNPQKLLVALKDKELKALVYNIPQLTLGQIKYVIGDKEVQQLLNDEFMELTFKSYRIWLRKK